MRISDWSSDVCSSDLVKKQVVINEGASITSLTRLSHIHLFGISFIFFFMGLIFTFAVGIPRWLKVLLIAFPFGFLILDVLSRSDERGVGKECVVTGRVRL